MIPDNPHPAIARHADEVARGELSRREFLARATSLGLTAAGAYGMLGLRAPAYAQDRQDGGTLRIQQQVMALKDPRLFDWPQMSNVTRGWLEYLAEYQRDGSITPMLLESWEVNEDATEYVLHLRPGITWTNGDPFTAEDVAFNIRRWCDKSVEGNSMVSRMATLIDEATGTAREGAIEVADDMTVILRPGMPDITIIAGFTDFPAAIVHQSFSGDPLASPIGTGPYLPEAYEVGQRAVLVRNADFDWWGTDVFGPATLDRIEFLDFGPDQSAIFAAADADEIDMIYESVGEFRELFDALGWEESESLTAATLVIRPNQAAEVNGMKPYADVRVRRALSMAVSNDVLLELGYSGNGVVAANFHVAPIHPAYADIGPAVFDPDAALALLEEAGMADFEHELISIDDEWRRNTADAMAAQLRDAGIKVKRTILPGSTFWNGWTGFPFSVTDWAHRPLGIQTLALAYRSGEPWNETAFSNARFDELVADALSIADVDARREVMAELEQLLRDEGVVTQPYWRSTFRHAKPGIVGAEQHPTFELHLYRLGLAA
ncbi:oligopeptide/dipeptide ABC transporter, periplasmic substrate-binding protein [Oceaniovalibus guishaninsula JLT2003]|uniref:Oligopeptide/dipeptide ABC transporter, periplasmic substrate-binding protein n=1 Tax=Oceaniovalibus guishaninsula JLT2003 TaxID=1231392 RepID=K2HRU2_9RHOB|nr:ABC transporter substrate-binding protein [Oceaniovalibus guishaninsula]EKE45444.1 oligopeptide/dipeptide ABC transporter, periplasmic substrate-binding protein [Oceaniovalibus guishaninsula JLT2003]